MWNNVIGEVIDLTEEEILKEVLALYPNYIDSDQANIISEAIYEIVHTDPDFFSDFRMIVADETDLEEGEGFISIYNDCFMDEITIRAKEARNKRKDEIIKDALLIFMCFM